MAFTLFRLRRAFQNAPAKIILISSCAGGAADIERRILRVRFVADILWEFGFSPVVRNDAVSATLKNLDQEEGQRQLAVAGYMTIHTRQLDMIMQDPSELRRVAQKC